MLEPIRESDRAEVRDFVAGHWHAPHICIRGRLYHPDECDGFIVRRGGGIAGLVTFVSEADAVLMVTLNSTESGTGIGTSLVLRVIEEARKRDARRVWLTTTNDNLNSMGFYQRMGFRIVAIYRDAVNQARQTIKPEVPEFGMNGLPIHDEIEMELALKPLID